MKKYTHSPLPFQGQKRNFLKEIEKIASECPKDTIFVDLFGGSGILSNTIKRVNPTSTVIFNDFDNFKKRVDNIPKTNSLLEKFRKIVAIFSDEAKIDKLTKEKIKEEIENFLIEEENNGYIDFLTISSAINFSCHYCSNLEELKKSCFYNNIPKKNYEEAKDYFEGLTIRKNDYKELFEEFKDNERVIFIIDPPYLSTDVKTYNENYWKLADYLEITEVLRDSKFLYFTSSKSNIVELLDWMEKTHSLKNPLSGCERVDKISPTSLGGTYTDSLLYKI